MSLRAPPTGTNN